MDPSTRRFAIAGRDPLDIPRFPVEQVDLIERIGLFSLALEDHVAAIPAEITLASTSSFKRQLARSQQKFLLGGRCNIFLSRGVLRETYRGNPKRHQNSRRQQGLLGE